MAAHNSAEAQSNLHALRLVKKMGRAQQLGGGQASGSLVLAVVCGTMIWDNSFFLEA